MLHHSCVRCRNKKIRCDGGSPCANCINSSVASECQRFMRKTRSRATRTVNRAPALNHCASPAISRPNNQLHQLAYDKSTREAEYVRGVSDDSTHYGTSQSPSPSSFVSSRPGTGEATTSILWRSTFASSSAQSPLHSDNAASATDMSAPVSSARFPESSPALRKASNYADSVNSSAQVSDVLLHQSRRTIGDHDAAQYVVDLFFYWRCSSMIYACVHIPTLKDSIRRLYSSDDHESVSEAEVALILMALAMSIQFTPRGVAEADQMHVCKRLGDDMSPVERQHALHALAVSVLQRVVFDSHVTLQQLQACLLINVYDLDSQGFKDQMRMHAVRCAEALAMDRIDATAPITVEKEMSVRAWWFLVCRDWFVAPKKSSYRINPAHFTTRLPLVVQDEVLSELLPDTPLSNVKENNDQWLPVRWTIPLIQLAALVRQLVDEKLRCHAAERLPFSKVEQGFCQLVDTLPRGFRLDESYTTPSTSHQSPTPCQQRFSIERWLLHQVIFATMLDFYEVKIGEPVSTQVVALANHILDLQNRLRFRCDVVDTLRVNVDGVVRAIAIIISDLMHNTRDQGSGMIRQITLGRVKDAILRWQKQSPATKADFDYVSNLLKAEARGWEQRYTTSGTTDTIMSNHLSSNVSGSFSSSSSDSVPFTPASMGVDVTMLSAHDASAALAHHFFPEETVDAAPMSMISSAQDFFSNPMSDNSRNWKELADLCPKDSGICPALHSDSVVVDRLWQGVMAFLQEPVAASMP